MAAKISVQAEAAKVAELSKNVEALAKAAPKVAAVLALAKDTRSFVAMRTKLASVGEKAYAGNAQRVAVLTQLEKLEDRYTSARKNATSVTAAAQQSAAESVNVAQAQTDRLLNLQRLASTLHAKYKTPNTLALVQTIDNTQRRINGQGADYNTAADKKEERAAIWGLVQGLETAYKVMASNGGAVTPEVAELLGKGAAAGGGVLLAIAAGLGLAFVALRR
jgi:hypothetical protein